MTRAKAAGFWISVFAGFALCLIYVLLSIYQWGHYGCLPWERCS